MASTTCEFFRTFHVLTFIDIPATSSDNPYNEFLPVVDGKVIIGHPTSLLRQGKFAQVPLIVGYVPLNDSPNFLGNLHHSRSTSNETSPRGSSDNIKIALQTSYPGLSDQDVQDMLEVNADVFQRIRIAKLMVDYLGRPGKRFRLSCSAFPGGDWRVYIYLWGKPLCLSFSASRA